VVRGALSQPRFHIDPGFGGGCCQWRRRHDVVDAPSYLVGYRIPGTIVPVGVLVGLIGMEKAENIRKSPFLHALERRPHLGVKVDMIGKALGVVDVDRLRGDVQIAQPDQRLRWRVAALEEGTQALEPAQLVPKLVGIKSTPLGDVGVDDGHVAYSGPHQAVLVGRLAIRQAKGHVGRLLARDEGHAPVATSPPVGDMIPCRANGFRRKVLVGALGLLHCQHIGPHPRQPVQDLFQADADRVGVVGGDGQDVGHGRRSYEIDRARWLLACPFLVDEHVADGGDDVWRRQAVLVDQWQVGP